MYDAFDCVDWDALWRGLRLHGMSFFLKYLVVVIGVFRPNKEISEHSDVTRGFCVKACVRHMKYEVQ